VLIEANRLSAAATAFWGNPLALYLQAIWNHAMVHRKYLCKDSKNIKGVLAKFRSTFSEGGIGKGVQLAWHLAWSWHLNI